MKKFHVFAGSNYYPSAGLGDYKKSFDDLYSAIELAKEITTANEDDEYSDKHQWSCVIEFSESGPVYRHVIGKPYGGFYENDLAVFEEDYD